MEYYKRIYDDSWNFADADTKQFTHCYHIYPAMMIPQIARRLINQYKPKGRLNLLFDPYMGSGTSLVEASLAGINSIGTDLNPLARLIARTKTAHYNESLLSQQYRNLQRHLSDYSDEIVRDHNFERISNYRYWYSDDSLLKLSYLTQLIDPSSDCADFFRVALAEVVREVSYTRKSEFKRFRMPEQKISDFHPDVFQLFQEKVNRNMSGLHAYNTAAPESDAAIYGFDSSVEIPDEIAPEASVDMVVTSPPYGDSRTTVAYGQFSRWANEWFGFENARILDRLLMGGRKSLTEKFQTVSIREELNSIKNIDTKRYDEVSAFLNDYWSSICHVARTIRPGGVICYVVGNRTVKGIQIPLDYFTIETFERCGFEHKVTFTRKIPNKRMPLKTSPTNKCGAKVDTMNYEYIVIMTKKI